MPKAQEWINGEYPVNTRSNVNKLLICNVSQREGHEEDPPSHEDIDNLHKHYLSYEKTLTGTLDLSDFTNLEEVVIGKQLINRLILTNCLRLKNVMVRGNFLKEVEWPSNPRNLEVIDLTNNRFPSQSLFCFSRFSRLRYLYLGTDNSERIQQRIYNQWNGSLVHLRNLNRLEDLTIDATDIDSGLEFLPTRKLIHFICGNKGRENAGVNRIKEICNFSEEEATSEDIDVNLEKVETIRNWQEEQGSYQNRIQVNR